VTDPHTPTTETPATEAELAEIEAQVAETIDLIRPALQMDGGDISLIGVDEDYTVTVELAGSCVGCPASVMTLKAGVERILKDRIPAVREVVAL
jgi:Fe-S cluster biogenesis protein NfuA